MSKEQRSAWTFEYKTGDVLDGATKKRDWHKGRLRFWEEQRERTKVQLKLEGLTIDESVAMGGSTPVYSNTGRRPSVSIDNEMMRDLDECNSKCQEHLGKEAAYAAWVAVLSDADKKKKLEMGHDDWLFFFGTFTAPESISPKFGSA